MQCSAVDIWTRRFFLLEAPRGPWYYPGLYPLDATVSTTSWLWQPNPSPDTVTRSRSVKITVGGDTAPPPSTLSTPGKPLEQSLQSQAAQT